MSNEYDKYKSNEDFKKYESLNSYIDDDKTIDTRDDKFDKVVTLKVTKETFEMWEQLCENWGEVLGYDNKSKVFEFAIVEALNVQQLQIHWVDSITKDLILIKTNFYFIVI